MENNKTPQKVRIDVTKITEDMLFVGKKGTYLTFYINETPNVPHSDFECVVPGDKETGRERTRIGNAFPADDSFNSVKPKKTSNLPNWMA